MHIKRTFCGPPWSIIYFIRDWPIPWGSQLCTQQNVAGVLPEARNMYGDVAPAHQLRLSILNCMVRRQCWNIAS